MNWKKTFVVLVIVAMSLFILGCAEKQPAPTPTPESKPAPEATPSPEAKVPEKIVIGGTLSLSGKYANEGQMSLWGIQAALKWLNDVNGGIDIGGKKVKVEFKYYDDEAKKETVQSLYDRLITVDKVDVLLAPYSSGLTLAAAPIADKNGKVYMSHGGASDRIFEQGYTYVVQTLSPASKYQTGALDMVKAIDPTAKRVAFVYEDSEFSKAVFKGAKEYAEQLGFEVVFDKTYPRNPTDLTPLLSEMKAAEPDIILGGGHFADGQLLATQLAELKINAKLVSIIVAPALPKFYDALGVKAEGIVGPGQWEVGVKYSPEAAKAKGIEYFGPTQDEFMQYFKEVAGEDKTPSYHAAEAGAAILAIAKAIENAQSTDSDAIRNAFNNLHMITFFGEFKIDPTTGKQLGHEMVLFQWQGGKKVIIWPPEAATGEPYYPIPTWEEKEQGKMATK